MGTGRRVVGLIACNSAPLRARFVKDLSARFPTEDKGDLEWMLNVSIKRDRASRSITLSQELYVTDLIAKFGLFVDKAITRRFDCPMDEGTVLSPDDQSAVGSPAHKEMTPQREAYMSLVGGYLWLSNMTMWHLAFAAGQLARYLTNPGPSHFRAAIRVLAYLQHSGSRPLIFRPNSSLGLDITSILTGQPASRSVVAWCSITAA